MQSTDSRYAGRHRIVDHRAPSVPGFEVIEPIGQGGSGSVWSATDAAGQSVAVKIVPADRADDAQVELAVLSRLSEPHLVRLHDAIALESGDIALVLDHCAGGSLGAAVQARGHLAPGEVVTVLSPIASTLGRLHGHGVVHGDVSPGNVLLDREGTPFLADLGIARILGEQSLDVRGTEGFVAPEVLLGARPSAASDVHALGALAWFCLTGDAPGPAVVRDRLADRVPDLSLELVTVVEAALRSQPEDRPDADALAVALFESAEPQPLQFVQGSDEVSLLTRRIRAAAGGRVNDAGVRVEAESAASRARAIARSRGERWVRARRWAAVTRSGARRLAPFVVVFGAITAVAFGVLAWSGGREDARAASPSPITSATSPGGPAPRATSTSDPRVDRQAPSSDPVALVQSLADARARAWSSGIAARLIEVDAPRSPALERDTTVMTGVQRDRQRYVGLTFAVRDATRVSGSQGVTTLRTRIDTGAHVVRAATGEQQRPEVRAEPVLLDLVWTDSGWRVHDVRSV